jgi:hypothetical protein
MGTLSTQIRSQLHATDPFEGFDHLAYPHDMRGGVLTDVMARVFNALRPRFIVEVGTWRGRSACFWADLMRKNALDGCVLCIDTWLGGLEHLLDTPFKEWEIRGSYKHGYPTLYYQFLANVRYEGLQDYIVPLATSSLIGARWLVRKNLKADVVYIDASHDEDDVYNDLKAYWPALRTGGIMCGDDFRVEWYSVICGVNRFARELNLNLQVAMPTWVIQKT